MNPDLAKPSLALIPQQLGTIQELIAAKEKELEDLRTSRDALIIEAVSVSIPYSKIMRWTGLSRSNIIRIQAKKR